MTDFSYEAWAPTNLDNWGDQTHAFTKIDFHVDLGCGTVKKGRIGIDRFAAPGVNVVIDLETLAVSSLAEAPNEDAPARPPGWVGRNGGLPFASNSIKSIVSSHCLEHIGEGFLPLMDEAYRVLVPGGLFCAATPLFPSSSAVDDPDHCRYFTERTWLSFVGHLGSEDNPTGSWLDSFSVPYTAARFEQVGQWATPRCAPEDHWGPNDVRELRVALKAVK